MVWGIRGASYWRDEAATLAAVQRPFGALIRMLGHVDAVHGAYYMLIPAHGLTVAMTGPQPGGPGRGRLTARWAVASLLPVLLVSPLMVLGYAERQQISWIKPAGIDGIITVRELIGPAPLTKLVAIIVALSIAFCLLRGRVGLRAGWPPRLLALSVPWLVLPPALLLVASLIQPVYLFRYLMFCIPAVPCWAAPRWRRWGRPWARRRWSWWFCWPCPPSSANGARTVTATTSAASTP